MALAGVGGAAFGVVDKLCLGYPVLGSGVGLWCVVTAVLAAASANRVDAVLRVGAFLVGALAGYYLCTVLVFHFSPLAYNLAWMFAAVALSPLFALAVRHSRGRGWLAAVGAALPIGILLWEAWSLRFRLSEHSAQMVFDLVAAAALLIWLPSGTPVRIKAALLAPLAAGVAALAIPLLWSFAYRIGLP